MSDKSKVRFAATVSYDGADFYGSQRQPEIRTVQGEIEAATSDLFNTVTPVSLAGRTDAGVHAWGQVASFEAITSLSAETVERALGARLPDDIAIRNLQLVPSDFDPRRWAESRWYRYTLLASDNKFPLLRTFAWRVGAALDIENMSEAASFLTDIQDFRSCSGPVDSGRSTQRNVTSAKFACRDCWIWFDITANAFLPQMVRRIMGALVRVGKESLSLDEFSILLREGDLASVGTVAPPHGLELQKLNYARGYQS